MDLQPPDDSKQSLLWRGSAQGSEAMCVSRWPGEMRRQPEQDINHASGDTKSHCLCG